MYCRRILSLVCASADTNVVPNGPNPPKIKLTWCNFTNFPRKFQQILIISVSGQFHCFIFKICQTVVGNIMMNQFHDFFLSIFWRIFAICSYCVQVEAMIYLVIGATLAFLLTATMVFTVCHCINRRLPPQPDTRWFIEGYWKLVGCGSICRTSLLEGPGQQFQ